MFQRFVFGMSGRPSTKTRVNKSGEIKQVYVGSPFDPNQSLCPSCYRAAKRKLKQQNGIINIKTKSRISKQKKTKITKGKLRNAQSYCQKAPRHKPTAPPTLKLVRPLVDFYKEPQRELSSLKTISSKNSELDKKNNFLDFDFGVKFDIVTKNKTTTTNSDDMITDEMFVRRISSFVQDGEDMDVDPDLELKSKELMEINQEIQTLWAKFEGASRMEHLREKNSSLDVLVQELQEINDLMSAEMNRTLWE